jgi:hypothetical protein
LAAEWESNKDKSQEEWIREGFAEMGIRLSKEPSLANAPPLLLVLGNTNLTLPDRLNRARQLNAFRWLRDGRFDPRSLRWTEFAEEDRETAWRGLCRYTQLLTKYPPPMWVDTAAPSVAAPTFVATVRGLIGGTSLFGLSCLFWRRRLSH